MLGLGELRLRSARWRRGEIAYAVHHDHWRQGVGSGIAALLLDFGFDSLGLHRIEATCDPRNTGSARILEAIGMTHEGRLRQTVQIRDGWRDSEIFGILDHEWRARRA